jgi:hypothetical protein
MAMNTERPKIERRLRISGALLVSGLLVEAASLFWSHPTAFLLFLFFGGFLLAAGIVVYLYSLLPEAG